MKNNYYIFILLAIAVLTGGCKKYLQVKPEGTYTEDQVYAHAGDMQQALNGIYLDMASNELYGASLSNITIEIMAQRYKVPASGVSTENLPAVASYDYGVAQVQAEFELIWKKAFTTILAANVFLRNAETAISNRVIPTASGEQLRGEAFAIRAMLHFDMLRLFGPVYSLQPERPSIPYYTQANGNPQPILPASQVTDSVLADLSAAEALLANDPVKSRGIVHDGDFYSGSRNQRLNYYAVKALQARVLLWAGRTGEARSAALAVLQEGEKWFPWLDPSQIETVQPNPDRIFSPEILFGVYNPVMYVNYDARFNPALGEQLVLTSDPTRLSQAFENNDNDYRYNGNTWAMTTFSRKTFFKFADVPNTTMSFRFIQPLIRKSEMYYILAETETDPQQGLTYLNTVRNNRNLVSLTSTAALSNEIMKEYKKEFWGEGQLFFYYKRKNVSSVPGGSSIFSTVTPVYTVPLPLSETTPR